MKEISVYIIIFFIIYNLSFSYFLFIPSRILGYDTVR